MRTVIPFRRFGIKTGVARNTDVVIAHITIPPHSTLVDLGGTIGLLGDKTQEIKSLATAAFMGCIVDIEDGTTRHDIQDMWDDAIPKEAWQVSSSDDDFRTQWKEAIDYSDDGTGKQIASFADLDDGLSVTELIDVGDQPVTFHYSTHIMSYLESSIRTVASGAQGSNAVTALEWVPELKLGYNLNRGYRTGGNPAVVMLAVGNPGVGVRTDTPRTDDIDSLIRLQYSEDYLHTIIMEMLISGTDDGTMPDLLDTYVAWSKRYEGASDPFPENTFSVWATLRGQVITPGHLPHSDLNEGLRGA